MRSTYLLYHFRLPLLLEGTNVWQNGISSEVTQASSFVIGSLFGMDSSLAFAICPVAVVLIIWQTYTGSANGDAFSMAIHPWMVLMESLAFIILASAMCRYQGLYRFNQRLAKTSFFIYALHPIILGYIVRILHKVLPMDNWYVLTFNYLMAPLVCVGVCVRGYYLLARYMPEVLGVLVGERRK